MGNDLSKPEKQEAGAAMSAGATDALLERLRACHQAETFDDRIFQLWRSGFDTSEIAEKLQLAECFVANRLAHIRTAMVAA
jgi:hypothetical protein